MFLALLLQPEALALDCHLAIEMMIATLIILNSSSVNVALSPKDDSVRNFATYYKEVFENIGTQTDGSHLGYWKTGFINLFVLRPPVVLVED